MLQRADLRRRTRSPRTARFFFPFVYAALCIVFCQPSSAQQTVNTEEEVVSVETNLVAVPVYVTDSKGRRVRDLKADDFSLRDEGTAVPVSYFAAGTERVALAFLLDASGSVRDIATRQREAALALLSRFGSESRVAVYRFAERAEASVPFTRERARVREAFLLPALANRRTAIFDAALDAARSFRNLKSERAERRIVILLSDGLDTASTMRARAVVEEAQAAGVSFYVIYIPLYAPRGNRLAPRPFAKGFRELAKETGGQFFSLEDAAAALDPRTPVDLAPVFQAIADDLQGQYVLGFHAPDAALRERGRPRNVSVSLTNQRKLRVHALRDNYQLQ